MDERKGEKEWTKKHVRNVVRDWSLMVENTVTTIRHNLINQLVGRVNVRRKLVYDGVVCGQ